MKFRIPKKYGNLKNIMQKAGYRAEVKNNAKEPSFSKRLGSADFPRFHIYVGESSNSWIFKLHLDRKRHSYGSETAHSGEYEGPIVEKEAERIERIFASMDKAGKASKISRDLNGASTDNYDDFIKKNIWIALLIMAALGIIISLFLIF